MDESLEPHSATAGSLSATAPGAHYILANQLASVDTISRATSPGLPDANGAEDDGKKRYRPRTFKYFNLLPYPVEDGSQRDEALAKMLAQLYTAVSAEDYAPGVLHWTRELQGWLNLKFEMTRELRAKLAKLYYHITLAPGLDPTTADRCTKMLITLTRYGTPAAI
jgi:proteasome activator subunit 4